MKKKLTVCILAFISFMIISSTKVFAAPPVSAEGYFIDTTGSIHKTYGGISGYNTHTFRADLSIGGFTLSDAPAYCTNHLKSNVTRSDRVRADLYTSDTDGYDGRIAAILYYGAGGPGDVTGGRYNEDAYFATTYMLHYFIGDGNKNQFVFNYNPYMWILHTHAQAQDAPKDFAYILYTPLDNPNLQVIASYAGMVPQTGDLRIIKKDDSGLLREGAQFHIWGPGGDWWRTTDSNGEIFIGGISQGTYYIEETNAPSGLINPEYERVKEVYVTSGQTFTYERYNSFPRGSVRLVKYDADNRGNTKGDATLAGAVYNLYAAQDIYEGEERKYASNQLIKENIVTDEYGNTQAVTDLPLGNYYYQEIQPSEGFNINGNRINVSINYVDQYTTVIAESLCEAPETPIYGNIEILKRLGALDYDEEINLAGAQFKATYIDENGTLHEDQVYYSNISGEDGICRIIHIPYGEYVVEECLVPPEAEKIENFNVTVSKENETYKYTKVDTSKDMKIEVNKEIYMRDGGATDAKVEGAYFTVYRDEACTDEVCVIGPTDASGYAISGTMRTGTYYLKETTFPVGFDPDATIPGEEVTYREKVYMVTADNTVQGTELVTVPITIQNEPVYGHIEILKRLGELDYDPEINLEGAQFKATLISNPIKTYYSNVSGKDGICRIENLPYGEYVVEECVTPPEAERIANFNVFVEEKNKTYEYTKVDNSKDMKIEIYKEILLHEGEATDAKVEGAYFTVYRDAQGEQEYIDKNGETVVIGPTDANGYAISGTMRTGTYYLKETTFPEGIDPDATIPGEEVTYREKVYMVTADNTVQGTELVTVPITIQNEPNRNDIEIYKEIGATSNTPQFPLDKCEFTAILNSDPTFTRKCTAQTDENGYCIIEDLPYGEYTVTESLVSPISLKCEDFTVFVEKDRKVQVEPYSKDIVDTPKVMQIKIRKVDANREETDAPDYTQGDATLEGAIYQIYRYDPQTDGYTEKVYDIEVDHQDEEGYWCAESKDLLVGKYMAKEKISHTETVDGVTYNYSYAEGYLADPNEYYFDQDPAQQTVERTYHEDVSREEVIRGRVEVIKYDNILGQTEEAASEGAILRLTLKSNPEKYYELTIDKYGYGEFVEEESRDKYYPYTIPYGEYELTEIKESNEGEHTHWFIQPEDVTIKRQVQKEYRIEADEPVEFYLKVQKRDADTGATVNLAGAEFKIWDCQEDKWLELYDTTEDKKITTYKTNEEGSFITPQKIKAGDYIIYETKAPEGYYLHEEWRIPTDENGKEDESKVGVIGEGGKHVRIDKAAMEIEENKPANQLDLYYIVDMEDEPLMSKLEIVKTGEMFTNISQEQTEYGSKYTPIWELRGLEGVTYEIYAAKDIVSPDGRVTYVEEGEKVDTITTKSEGIATSKELYPGEYRIEEIEAPEGYLIDEEIENVVLESKDELVRVETTTKELNDVRQKLLISLRKEFEDINFANGQELEQRAVFGVYTKDRLQTVDGKEVIEADSLLDIIEVEGNEDVTSTIDLPEGSYYVRELETSYPYTINEETREVEVRYEGNEREFITYELEGMVNDYEEASLTLIKISTTTLLEDIILTGSEINVVELDKKVEDFLNTIRAMTPEEVEEYMEEEEIKGIPGAVYGIYIDEECTKPLYIREEGEEEYKEAQMVTTEKGMIRLDNIPLGRYYIKEIKAPEKYEIAENVISVDLTRENKEQMVYRVLNEYPVKSGYMEKIDIFTGEKIPNCEFEIRNEEGEVILRSTTDEEGTGYIPVDLFEEGKKYTYKEVKAPEIYELNEEEFEFTAHFDEEGNWAVEKQVVENTRKDSRVTFEKLDFADSTPIPNCKFELKSLETDYVVEGVTDENGIYVFENVPYGKYTYREIEAPEEYIIDTEAHEIEINAEEMKVRITNEKAPETGDIAVVAIVVIAVVCVAGIVIVIVRRKRQNKEK